MAHKIGIWMDKRVAKIITAANGGEMLSVVDSDVEEFNPTGGSGSRLKGGPQDVVQDSKYTEREKHQFRAFFNEIIANLPDTETIVLFGPAQSAQKFADDLEAHHHDLYQKVVGVEIADSQTDNQMVAWVRDYYQ